jgi:hypothetical protein
MLGIDPFSGYKTHLAFGFRLNTLPKFANFMFLAFLKSNVNLLSFPMSIVSCSCTPRTDGNAKSLGGVCPGGWNPGSSLTPDPTPENSD